MLYKDGNETPIPAYRSGRPNTWKILIYFNPGLVLSQLALRESHLRGVNVINYSKAEGKYVHDNANWLTTPQKCTGRSKNNIQNVNLTLLRVL